MVNEQEVLQIDLDAKRLLKDAKVCYANFAADKLSRLKNHHLHELLADVCADVRQNMESSSDIMRQAILGQLMIIAGLYMNAYDVAPEESK